MTTTPTPRICLCLRSEKTHEYDTATGAWRCQGCGHPVDLDDAARLLRSETGARSGAIKQPTLLESMAIERANKAERELGDARRAADEQARVIAEKQAKIGALEEALIYRGNEVSAIRHALGVSPEMTPEAIGVAEAQLRAEAAVGRDVEGIRWALLKAREFAQEAAHAADKDQTAVASASARALLGLLRGAIETIERHQPLAVSRPTIRQDKERP